MDSFEVFDAAARAASDATAGIADAIGNASMAEGATETATWQWTHTHCASSLPSSCSQDPPGTYRLATSSVYDPPLIGASTTFQLLAPGTR